MTSTALHQPKLHRTTASRLRLHGEPLLFAALVVWLLLAIGRAERPAPAQPSSPGKVQFDIKTGAPAKALQPAPSSAA
jgi:hypothetical protein